MDCIAKTLYKSLIFSILLILFSSSLIAAGPAPVTQSEESVAKEIDLAWAAFKASRFDQAVDHYLRAYLEEPDLPPGSFQRVRLYGGITKALLHADAYQEALHYARLTQEASWEYDKNPGVLVYQNMGRIGAIYLQLDQPDSALLAFHQSSAYIPYLNHKERLQTGYLNNVGMAWEEIGNLDSASYYFRKALANCPLEEEVDSLLRLSILDNLGQLHLHHQDYAAAEETFAFILSELNHFTDPPGTTKQVDRRRVLSRLRMMEVLSSAGKPWDMEPYVLELQELFRQVRYFEKMKHQVEFKRLYHVYLTETGQWEKASLAAIDLLHHSDSMHLVTTQAQEELNSTLIGYRITEYRQALELSKLRGDEQAAALELSNTRVNNQRLIFLILVILLLGTGVLIISRYAKEKQIKERQVELEKVKSELAVSQMRNVELEREKLEQDIRQKEKDITDFALDLSRKQEWIERIQEQLDELMKKADQETQKEIKDLKRDIRVQVNLEKKISLFREKIDTVNNRFFQVLGNEYPELTQNEKELCGLIRMKLSNKEIASIRIVDPKSVKMAKYRLRKKLQLGEGASLEAFLEAV